MGTVFPSLRTRTLARDLALGITVTATLVMLFIAVGSHVYYVAEQEKGLEAQADTLIGRLARSVAEPLWQIDHDGVRKLGQVNAARPDVVELRIFADDEALVFATDNAGDADGLIRRSAPVYRDGFLIGRLEVALSPARIYAEAFWRLRILLALGLAVTMAVIGMIYLLLGRFLTRPLTALTAHLHQLAEGDYAARIPARGLVDLDTIAEAVNTMARAIEDRDDRLHAANEGLEARVIQRTEGLQEANTRLEAEVTIRQQAEASLALLTRELETKNLALKEKNDELERRNAEMERFTYTVSHDLKSPLVTIKNFLGLVELDAAAGDAERLKGDLTHIGNAADHMLRLLTDLLELSRVGRLMNPPEAVPLADLVAEAIAHTLGGAEAAAPRLTVSPEMPVVWGDRVRLAEVFQNLISNATKFMGTQPAPHIEISAEPSQRYVVCTVRDNGIGIPPRFHDNIFGLFNRLHPEIDGTGVGLAVVKRIVEFHGGRIWVESEGMGTGAAFHFTLPAVPVSPAAEVAEVADDVAGVSSGG